VALDLVDVLVVFVVVDVGFIELELDFELDELLELHVPPTGLHPVPQ